MFILSPSPFFLHSNTSKNSCHHQSCIKYYGDKMSSILSVIYFSKVITLSIGKSSLKLAKKDVVLYVIGDAGHNGTTLKCIILPRMHLEAPKARAPSFYTVTLVKTLVIINLVSNMMVIKGAVSFLSFILSAVITLSIGTFFCSCVHEDSLSKTARAEGFWTAGFHV